LPGEKGRRGEEHDPCTVEERLVRSGQRKRGRGGWWCGPCGDKKALGGPGLDTAGGDPHRRGRRRGRPMSAAKPERDSEGHGVGRGGRSGGGADESR
jgi:hypothetical protein